MSPALQATVISGAGTAIVLRADGSAEVIPLPSARNCAVDKLFEIAEGLPENFCLSIDRETGNIRVLECAQACRLYFGEPVGVEAGQGTPDQSHGELLQAPDQEGELSEAPAEIGDQFLIVHRSVPSTGGAR